MEKLVLKKKYKRELRKLQNGKNLIRVPSSYFPIDVSYLSEAEKKEHEEDLRLYIKNTSIPSSTDLKR